VNVAAFEQAAADTLARAALEKNVVGHDDCGCAVRFKERVDVLQEV
jgi:hypothetical protein